jgi:cytochrome c oxidase subunit 4
MRPAVTHHSNAAAGEAHAGHVMSRGALLGTAGALLLLTAITVSSSRLDLGEWNVVLALAIACTKATLVALFFMHLKYENRFQAVVVGAAVIFAVLFVTFVVFDTTQYQPGIREAAERVRSP